MGLQIIKLVDDMDKMFDISRNLIENLQIQLQNKLCKISTIYKDHEEVYPLFEMPDLDGKTAFDYMIEFQLYELLGTNLM